MKKLIPIFIAILFTACTAPSPQVTVTSEVIVNFTLTRTPTPLPLTITLTPIVELIPSAVPEDQQTLSTEADSHVVVSWEGYHGWYQEAVQKAAEKVVFPPLANNQGWEQPRGQSEKALSIELVGNNIRLKNQAVKFISICYMPGDVFGHPEKELGIATFAVLNPDGTKSVFSIAADSGEVFKTFIDPFNRNEISIGIMGWMSSDFIKLRNSDDRTSWFTESLIEKQGGIDNLKKLSIKVAESDIFDQESSQTIWFAAIGH